jgi:hypothetical protein
MLIHDSNTSSKNVIYCVSVLIFRIVTLSGGLFSDKGTGISFKWDEWVVNNTFLIRGERNTSYFLMHRIINF